MAYVLRPGLADLTDLAPNDPILQNPLEGTTYGAGPTGGSYPVNPIPSPAPRLTATATSGLSDSTLLLVGAGALFVLLLAKAGR